MTADTAMYTGAYHVFDGVLARSVGDVIVLFHPETERLLTLNGTGARVWECLVQGQPAERIVASMVDEFDGAEPVIRQQVQEFLYQLEGERVICRPQQ